MRIKAYGAPLSRFVNFHKGVESKENYAVSSESGSEMENEKTKKYIERLKFSLKEDLDHLSTLADLWENPRMYDQEALKSLKSKIIENTTIAPDLLSIILGYY